jgi:His/Glu/Gln/Arg/opine family amino acid ABC transporter permease subunit
MALATIFGFIGALGRLSRFAPIRWLATVYVEVVRGTPILVQLLLWYYGVGYVLSNLGFDPYGIAFQVMTTLQNNSLVPDQFNGYFYGIIGLSFNYGAYLTEVLRSGMTSVEKGQTEAALSLGLNSTQIMRRIVLPQAVRITIPPFTNYFITLIQDSALLSILSVIELDHQTFALALPQTDASIKFFVFILGALIYLAICYPLALLARYLEARMAKAY